MKKILCITFLLFTVFAVSAFGFEFKSYVWGTSLSAIQGQLAAKDIKTVYDNKSDTLVYSDIKFDKECKVSLLFTPKSQVLAGAAVLWDDASVFKSARKDMIQKYGKAIESEKNSLGRKTYLWYSPTNKYDRITLINGPNVVILGYFGGESYRQYQQEMEAR